MNALFARSFQSKRRGFCGISTGQQGVEQGVGEEAAEGMAGVEVGVHAGLYRREI